MVYDTTLSKLYLRAGGAWQAMWSEMFNNISAGRLALGGAPDDAAITLNVAGQIKASSHISSQGNVYAGNLLVGLKVQAGNVIYASENPVDTDFNADYGKAYLLLEATADRTITLPDPSEDCMVIEFYNHNPATDYYWLWDTNVILEDNTLVTKMNHQTHYILRSVNGAWYATVVSKEQPVFEIDLSAGDYNINGPGNYFITNAAAGAAKIFFPTPWTFDGREITIVNNDQTDAAIIDNGSGWEPVDRGSNTSIADFAAKGMYILKSMRGKWRALF
jgi:hypothetical protein